MQLTYVQLAEALAQMNNISGNDGGAFRARLRKLQGEGIPGDANPGKGRRVAYTLPLVIEATVAVELLQMGWSLHKQQVSSGPIGRTYWQLLSSH